MDTWAKIGFSACILLLAFLLFIWPKNNGPELVCFHSLNLRNSPRNSLIFVTLISVILLASLFSRNNITDTAIFSLCLIFITLIFICLEFRDEDNLSLNMNLHVPIAFLGIISLMYLMFTWDQCNIYLVGVTMLIIPFLTRIFGRYLYDKQREKLYKWIWWCWWVLLDTIFITSFLK